MRAVQGELRSLRSRFSIIGEILKPSGVRSKVIIFILLLSFVGMVIALDTNIKLEKLPKDFLLSFSSSAISAAVIEGIDQITQKTEKVLNKIKFLRLFSCFEDINGVPIIINSAFDLNLNLHESGNIDYSDLKQNASKDLSRVSTKAAVKSDVIASSNLASAFSEIKVSTPDIEWDEDIDWDNEIAHAGVKKKSYILVGLSSSIVDIINRKSIQGRYFSIQRSPIDDDPDVSCNSIKCAIFNERNEMLEEHSWLDYNITWDFKETRKINVNERDIAIFAKVCWNHKIFLVCGGTTDLGTECVSNYVKKRWKYIYSELEKEKGHVLNYNDSFTIIFSIPFNGMLEEASIVKTCIKRHRH